MFVRSAYRVHFVYYFLLSLIVILFDVKAIEQLLSHVGLTYLFTSKTTVVIQEPLTWEERQLLPFFVAAFRVRVESPNAIKATQIVKSGKEWARKWKISTPINVERVRKIIRHIRLNHIIPNLVASSKGYYVTNDPLELERYIDSLAGRVEAIGKVSDEMIEDLNVMQARKTA
jgi:hypothetical protein